MTALSVVFASVAGAAALADWWSRAVDHRRTELWAKPVALVGLIGVAVTLDPVDGNVRVWFVVALVWSLAGDVLLLDDRRFVAGLAVFLAGHVAYTVGFVVAEPWRWWSAALATVLVVALTATAGRRIVAGARRHSKAWTPPMVAYLIAISAMAVTAAGAGNGWAVLGASLFVTSDAVLGWRRFVEDRPWMSVAVMVTYHLGQAGLVASLL